MTGTGCKVCRIRDAYDLNGLDETLLERWQRDENRQGYRRLATYLNAAILEYELERAGLYTLEAAATVLYDRLSNGDPETTRRLQAEGIPIADLERDFVSYGVVRTHLTECLGGEAPTVDSDGDWGRTALDRIVPRLETRAERAIGALASRDRLDVPDTAAFRVETVVRCTECGGSTSVENLLEGDSLCDCVEEAADINDSEEG